MLRRYMGPLISPPFAESETPPLISKGEALNAEGVLLECLTNNPDLCYSSVPRDLIECFGELMNAQPVILCACVSQGIEADLCVHIMTGSVELCSYRITSNFMFTIRASRESHRAKSRCAMRSHFWSILCYFFMIFHTLFFKVVLDVILSDRLEFVGRCIEIAYRGVATVACPDKIIRLLSATIAQGNVISASKLQEKRYTLDASLSLLDKAISMLKKVEAAASQLNSGEAVVENLLLSDPRFCSMVAQSH
jgi:hypothetical protein